MGHSFQKWYFLGWRETFECIGVSKCVGLVWFLFICRCPPAFPVHHIKLLPFSNPWAGPSFSRKLSYLHPALIPTAAYAYSLELLQVFCLLFLFLRLLYDLVSWDGFRTETRMGKLGFCTYRMQGLVSWSLVQAALRFISSDSHRALSRVLIDYLSGSY